MKTVFRKKRTPRGKSSSAVHTSPGDHAIGTRAIERKDQPKGICDPPMQSIWRLEMCVCVCEREREKRERERERESF